MTECQDDERLAHLVILSSLHPFKTASDMNAIPLEPSQPTVRIPWGKWGVRTLAFAYLAVLLVIPLLVILQDGLRGGLGELWRQVTLPVAWHALMLTLWTAAVMTLINAVMGTLTAYVLVRYEFPAKGC